MSARTQEDTSKLWLLIFVLLSLVAHFVAVLAFILISIFVPKPKLDLRPISSPSVSLSLQQAPPPAPVAPPPPQHLFMPTTPDATAPHKDTLIESDNDTQVKSQSKTSRNNQSVMLDIVKKNRHPANLHDAPNNPSPTPPQVASAAPSQKKEPTKQIVPPQPNQQPQIQPQPTEPQPTPQTTATSNQPPPPTPNKAPAPQVSKNTIDPTTGLPVLPPLNAPTIAPQNAPPPQNAQPANSVESVAADLDGRAGMSGEPSPEAMATELGRYKAKVYRAVGARWYSKVDKQLQVLPVGIIHIQFTIHSDGTVDTKVLGGDTGAMQLLLSISLNSILEAAPFDPFSPAMIKEVGDSYTDDFSFSIYGG